MKVEKHESGFTWVLETARSAASVPVGMVSVAVLAVGLSVMVAQAVSWPVFSNPFADCPRGTSCPLEIPAEDLYGTFPLRQQFVRVASCVLDFETVDPSRPMPPAVVEPAVAWLLDGAEIGARTLAHQRVKA